MGSRKLHICHTSYTFTQVPYLSPLGFWAVIFMFHSIWWRFPLFKFDKFRDTRPLDITWVSAPSSGGGNTFNWIIEDLEELGSSFSQSHWHLYFPSSASVTLTMVRIKSVLHLVLVFLSCISYFSPDFNSPGLLLKYHRKELSRQSLGLTPTSHFKLILE